MTAPLPLPGKTLWRGDLMVSSLINYDRSLHTKIHASASVHSSFSDEPSAETFAK